MAPNVRHFHFSNSASSIQLDFNCATKRNEQLSSLTLTIQICLHQIFLFRFQLFVEFWLSIQHFPRRLLHLLFTAIGSQILHHLTHHLATTSHIDSHQPHPNHLFTWLINICKYTRQVQVRNYKGASSTLIPSGRNICSISRFTAVATSIFPLFPSTPPLWVVEQLDTDCQSCLERKRAIGLCDCDANVANHDNYVQSTATWMPTEPNTRQATSDRHTKHPSVIQSK